MKAPTRGARTSERSPGSRHLAAAALLFAALLAAFSNSFSAGFVFDSKPILLQDPHVRQATSENIGLIFQHTYWWPAGEAGIYRPFTTLSYLFNYAILGNAEDPAGYHWVNFLIHAFNVWLVYILALRLTRKFRPSLFLALLWAVHPVLTESVTNLVGRADLLAGAAVLSGLWLYLKSTESSGARRAAWAGALGVVALLGFLSKESAVVLLGVIALFEFTWWGERRQVRGLLVGGLALALPLIVMLYQRAVVLAASPKADFPFTDNPIQGAGFWTGKLTAVKVLADYLLLTVWPAKLSADYSYSQIPLATGSWQDWMAWFAVIVFAAAVVWLYRANRTAFFLACFGALTLLPGSNLIFPTGTIMAERFLYLPAIGVVGCLVLGVYAAAERFGSARVAPVILGVICAAFAARTWARNVDWRDDLSLDTATVLTSPNSFKAHKMLAVALMESGSGDAQLDREIDEARKSMALVNSLPDVRNDPAIYRLAATLYLKKGDQLRLGDPASATQVYRDALAAMQRNIAILHAIAPSVPLNAESGRLLSLVYERLGDRDRAITAASQARQSDPLNPLTYRQLADADLAAGRANDAAIVLMEGMIVTQDLAIRRELVDVYQSGIDTQGCALIDGPNGKAINPACTLIHNHLCAIAPDAIQVRLATGRRDIAEQMRHSFLSDYGCPAGPIDAAMAGSSVR